jgi:hypothetical protein
MMKPNTRIPSIYLEARSGTSHGSAFAKRAHRAAPVLAAQAVLPNSESGSGDIFGQQLPSIVYGRRGPWAQ